MYHAVQMTSPKERLLTAAIDYVATNGMSDLSLRQLASAIGTSHRMLIYHFGSKEGLLVELIRAVEQRQRDALLELTPGGSLVEVARQFWQRLTDPALWPHERLFFEIYGQALQGRPGTTELLDGIVANWVEPVTELLAQQGIPNARAKARLGLAVTRGLLLDLLATGDQAGVNEAMEAFLSFYAADSR
jgi:AcrR family transcriptional regulator